MTWSRRGILRAAAGGLVSAAIAGCRGNGDVDPAASQHPQSKVQTAIIDTHTHFYDPSRTLGVPWPPKNDAILYRTVLPEEFRKLATPLGVTGTVVVEASPWLGDNQWVLDLATRQATPIVGVVGNLAMGDPDFKLNLKRLAANPLFRGLRLRDRPLEDRLTGAAFLDDVTRLADAGLSLDVNGKPESLQDVARLADRMPELRIIVDHCGNVAIDGKAPPAKWLADMRRLGALGQRNVWCKVSGLVEGTGKNKADAPREVEFYRPVLDALWEAFGADRLVYGSNWPVCTRFGDYARVLGIVKDYFAEKGDGGVEKYFQGNARVVYGLRQPRSGERL